MAREKKVWPDTQLYRTEERRMQEAQTYKPPQHYEHSHLLKDVFWDFEPCSASLNWRFEERIVSIFIGL
jgi:hypothetical protein